MGEWVNACACVYVFNVHGAYAESTIQTFIIFFTSSGSTFLLRHFIFFFFILWLVFIYQPTLVTYSQLFSYVFVVSIFLCLQPFCIVLFRIVHVFCPFPTHEK